MTGVGEEAAVTVGGNVKGAAAAGGAQSDPAAPQLRSRRRCRRAESGPSGVSTPVSPAAPRIIARWEPASVPISRRMGTAGPAGQMEYYPAFKKEILPCSTTRMRLEDVTPSEISQSQKDKKQITEFQLKRRAQCCIMMG